MDDNPLSNVSLVVITFNEESNIERCLGSAEGVGEIVVVDSFSTDDTSGLARRAGAIVYQRPFISAADQKNWAIQKASREWVLVLDADESLSGELKREIGRAVAGNDRDGYWLKRRNIFLGKRVRYCGWQRDRVMRLFRRARGHYPPRTVHEKLVLEGTAGRLHGPLFHVPYRDVDDYLDRMKNYSRLGAEDLFALGAGWFPAIILNPPARFVRMYILQLGFLDGAAGIALCGMAAAGVLFKYVRLRELYRERGRKEHDGKDA
jgi:glycosyltransferase involved in cell wall biosynthesis